MKPLQQWTKDDVVEFLKKVDQKTWAKSGLLGVVILLFLILMFWPAWIERFRIHTEVSSVEKQIKTVDTLNIRKGEWTRNKLAYQQLIQGAKARLYTATEASLLLGEISKLAKESKVTIVASVPKDFQGGFPKPFNEQYQGNLVDFTVEGAYHQFGQFMEKIENNPKLLQIQLFDIKPTDQTSKTQIASLSLSAVSFKKDKPA